MRGDTVHLEIPNWEEDDDFDDDIRIPKDKDSQLFNIKHDHFKLSTKS